MMLSRIAVTNARIGLRASSMLGLAGVLILAACGTWDEAAPLAAIRSKTNPSGIKLLLIGIDGATYSIIDPLIAAGKLPNTARLIERGARASLRSVSPMLSPALWTSMVTGRRRSEHGIGGFLTRGPVTKSLRKKRRSGPRLVSAHDLRTVSLWHILSAFGLRSGVIGWWVTWPAEKINGFIVSDRTARSRFSEWWGGAGERRTYPASLLEEVMPLVVDPADPPIEEFEALLDWTEAERAEFLAVESPIYAHGLSVLKFAYCSQRTYEEIALHKLAQPDQPDLSAVFLVGTDPASHTFWHYFEPERFDGVDPDKAARLGSLIPRIYQHNDAFLGRLLEQVDPETVVVIVSDHGFQASGELPALQTRKDSWQLRAAAAELDQVAVGQSGKHHPYGVMVAAGGPIRAGVTFGAGIHDVTPTLLALMGLPVGRDMAGRVLTELVEESFWKENPIRFVESYDRLIRRESLESIPRPPDPEFMNQLRALGYISDEAQ